MENFLARRAPLLDRTEYRRADEAAYLDRLQALRYLAYRRERLVALSDTARLADDHDTAPNAWVFGIHVDGELCASIRIHLLTRLMRTGFTAEVFGDALHPRLDRGETFVDASRLVTDPDATRRIPELPLLALRLSYMAADHFGADTCLAPVREEHQAFYRRVFRGETLVEPRAFPTAVPKIGLMASDFRASRDRASARFPILRSDPAERRALFGDPVADAAE